MRLFLGLCSIGFGLSVAIIAGVFSVTRPTSPDAIIGFLHVECTQYKVCEPEPHIYYITPNGDSLISTKVNNYFEYGVAWSPDGTAYAFNADMGESRDLRYLYVTDLLGGTPQRLSSDRCHQDYPAWSPDGNWIAYIQSCGQNQMLMKVRPNGQNPTLLADRFDFVGGPIWSVDGATIYAAVAISLTQHELYAFDTTRKQPTRLTETEHNESRPVVSPDGSTLLVQRWRDFDQWIFAMPLGGGEATLVSDASSYALAPRWSPTGEFVFYIDRDRENALMRVNANGSNRRQLVINAWEPRISPNGKQLLYLEDISQLAVVDIDGRHQAILPIPDGNVMQAEWVQTPSRRYNASVLAVAVGASFVGISFMRRRV